MYTIDTVLYVMLNIYIDPHLHTKPRSNLDLLCFSTNELERLEFKNTTLEYYYMVP